MVTCSDECCVVTARLQSLNSTQPTCRQLQKSLQDKSAHIRNENIHTCCPAAPAHHHPTAALCSTPPITRLEHQPPSTKSEEMTSSAHALGVLFSLPILFFLCVVPTDAVFAASDLGHTLAATVTASTLTTAAIHANDIPTPQPDASWLYGLIPPTQPRYTSDEPRPAGTLLLNMLTKNEAGHLNRTLPRWAAVIDYWVIGVDDANTDESEAVILRHLAHIPGRIVTVHFDGMGPTWTQLVQAGLYFYPQATHGIIADADFSPMDSMLASGAWDKMELDVRCSKHMYTIWTEDHNTHRRMDWIYRNIYGAKIERRTHQILTVPKLPNQEVFQTLTTLAVDEREGGYQDRSGEKDKRYIRWLELDLLDWPMDPRTLYYLAYAHLNLFLKDMTGEKGREALDVAVDYFKLRVSVKGNKEERWFALLKLAEIHERYKGDWAEAQRWYEHAIEMDGLRADPYFYVGQHYRLLGEYEKAYGWLVKGVQLEEPDRSLFQWRMLYVCLVKVEVSEVVTRWQSASESVVREAAGWLAQAKCDMDREKDKRRQQLNIDVRQQLAVFNKPKPKPKPTRQSTTESSTPLHVQVVRQLLSLYKRARDRLFTALPTSLSADLASHIDTLAAYVEDYRSVAAEERDTWLTCRRYRQATMEYVQWWKAAEHEVRREVERDGQMELYEKWSERSTDVRTTCR